MVPARGGESICCARLPLREDRMRDAETAPLNKVKYREEQNKSCMFEFPAFLLPTILKQPMHCQSALTEHVSLNLASFFCSTLFVECSCLP